MKKNILGAIFWIFFAVNTATAAQYKIFVPNPPGIGTDVIARKLADIYEKQTNNKLSVINVTGGNHILAVLEWRKQTVPSAIIGTATMHVFNYALIDKLPYNDEDFRHLFYFGDQPGFYITRPGTNITSIRDIIAELPYGSKPMIASHASNTLTNIFALNHFLNTKIIPVYYKSPQEVALAVWRGDVDVGIMSLGGTSALELVKAGHLKIIASTFSDDIKIQSINVPSISKKTGIEQFNGSASLSVNNLSGPEANKFAQDLLAAAASTEMMEFLEKNYIFHVKYDYTKTKDFIDQKRKSLQNRKTWFAQEQQRLDQSTK